MLAGKGRPDWVFSCYGPGRNAPKQLFGGPQREQSFEELRLRHYEAAASGREVNLDNRSVRSRDGITGERNSGDIGFATLRGGSVVGEHTVIFASDGERIELSHKATDRSLFARGAIRAALWGFDKSPGLYSMNDVLGI